MYDYIYKVLGITPKLEEYEVDDGDADSSHAGGH